MGNPNRYTPTTEEVRALYDERTQDGEFDRWKAENDRQAGEKALADAANAWTRGHWANAPRRADRAHERLAAAQFVGDWLRARAAALAGSEQEGTL